MKFVPVDRETLKNTVSDIPYVVIGVTDKDELCLELERDPNREKAFIVKIKDHKVASCQIRHMTEFISTYMKGKGQTEDGLVLCYAEDMSTAKAIADIYSDIHKLTRSLSPTDSTYRSVYSTFYNVAVELGHLNLV